MTIEARKYKLAILPRYGADVRLRIPAVPHDSRPNIIHLGPATFPAIEMPLHITIKLPEGCRLTDVAGV